MIRLLTLTLLYALGVIILHAAPTAGTKLGGIGIGWLEASHLLHVSMFIPWGVFGFYFVLPNLGGDLRRAAYWVLLGLIFGAGAESIQVWIPGRSFNSTDLCLNVLGVLLGTLAMVVWRFRIRVTPALTKSAE